MKALDSIWEISVKTIVDIYGHLFEGQQKRAAEAFRQAMRGES